MSGWIIVLWHEIIVICYYTLYVLQVNPIEMLQENQQRSFLTNYSNSFKNFTLCSRGLGIPGQWHTVCTYVGYLFSISVFSLNYFPLEGVLAERLFATFDKDKNNVIDYEEFLGELLLSTVHNTFLWGGTLRGVLP